MQLPSKEKRVELLKCRGLEEEPWGAEAQTQGSGEQELFYWCWCLWAQKRCSMGVGAQTFKKEASDYWCWYSKKAQWDWFCKCWKNSKLTAIAAIEQNCHCYSDADQNRSQTGMNKSLLPPPALGLPPVPLLDRAKQRSSRQSRNVACRV